MNHAKKSFSTEILAGAIISLDQYLALLRYISLPFTRGVIGCVDILFLCSLPGHSQCLIMIGFGHINVSISSSYLLAPAVNPLHEMVKTQFDALF
jgi:hypothetical protein